MEFTKFETISIRNHPELSEKWVQDRIAEDPSILGLGDVVLKDRERIQPRAGRLTSCSKMLSLLGDTRLRSSSAPPTKAILFAP